MLLSKQPGDTGIYATATASQVRLYYVLDRVLPFVSGGAVAAEAAGVLSGGSGSGALEVGHPDTLRIAAHVSAAPACVPREHLRMLYRLSATGTGASRTGGVVADAASPAAAASPPFPTSSSGRSAALAGSATATPRGANNGGEGAESPMPSDAAASAYRWGSPMIPFHTVPCSTVVGGHCDSARPFGVSAGSGGTGLYARLSQEWVTPSVGVTEDGGALAGIAHHGTFATTTVPQSGRDAAGGVSGVVPSGPPSVTRVARSVNSVRGTSSGAAAPTALSMSCATDCLLFFVANSEGHSWIGRSDSTTLSPLRVSTSLQVRRHGGVTGGANGSSRNGGVQGYHHGGTAASSSPRPPRPFSTGFGAAGNTSFPTHSFASSERMATPPNTIADDSVPNAAALLDSDSDDVDDGHDDDAAEEGEGVDSTSGGAGSSSGRRRLRGSSAGAVRPPSADGLIDGFPVAPSTMMSLPTGKIFSRHDRVVTASGWDPRNSAILAMGRQGGLVQLLDVEYMIGSAASTRCSSTTSSARSDDTAEPFTSSATGAARTMTSGGPRFTPYTGVDHLSYSVIQQREMVGPVTALDWMPQSHLTVVAARRRDGLGCYAELLDLRASRDGVTYLGAPPEVFGVPVYARGAESAAPSVLCSAEHVACHPSQRYVATVGTARMRDIVQLWDVRMTTRPVAYQVYARAGYTSLCWSAADTGVVLGTTRDGSLRAHSFKELSTRAAGGGLPSSSSPNVVSAGSGAPTAYGGGAGGASHRSRRRRGTSSGPPPHAHPHPHHHHQHLGGEPDLSERWGTGAGGGGVAMHNNNNPNTNNISGYSGTEAEAEDDFLDDSGSFRSGVSFDGAGTALSSTTEGSNALVHVNVKAQSALKCRLPSRVPAAAVAWVCRPTSEVVAAAEDKATGALRGSRAARRLRGNGGSDRGGSDDDDADGDGRNGTAARVVGVMERGCRTDLPQLLLLNAKNGELYTQVYNPQGSLVTILNQSMALVGAGPNAFIARASTAYKTATYLHEEMLMQALELKAARITAAEANKATPSASLSNKIPLTALAQGAAAANKVGHSGSLSAGPAAGSSGGSAQPLAGAGDQNNRGTTAGASTRRLPDRPVDLIGLGLLDEEDDEDEADELTGEGDGDENGNGGRHAGEAAGTLSRSSGSGDALDGSDGPAHVLGGNGDLPDGGSPSNSLTSSTAGRTAAGPLQRRRDGAHVAAEMLVADRGVPMTSGDHMSAGGSGSGVGGGRGRGVGHGHSLAAATAAKDPRFGLPSPPLAGGSGSNTAASSRPMSPLAERADASAEGGVDNAAASHVDVPLELSYCQFHRIERARLIWRRLRAGFSLDPVRNLAVLLHEGVDREAFTAFLYGCCVTVLLHPTASNTSAAFPLVLGVGRAVPGLLELLVSERRLRAQHGLRDTRLSSHFRLRQHQSALPTLPSVAADTASSSGISAASSPAAPPPTPAPNAAATNGSPLGFAASLLPGLPSATDRGHKGPAGFFRSPFEAAAATMRGGRLPTPGTLGNAGSMRGGVGVGASGRGGSVASVAAAPVAAQSRLGSSNVAATAAAGESARGPSSASSAAAVEQPTHAAAVGMLHRLILQSMGWLPPPAQFRVDGRGSNSRSSSSSSTNGRGDGGVAVARGAASSPGVARDAAGAARASKQTASRHPAERFFVQGDGIGQHSLQEALERRVAVLVLLDRLEEAAELLSLHSSRNPQYPSIALTLSAARGESATLLSLASPSSPGITFWMHLLLTYVELLMRQQHSRSRTASKALSSTSAQQQQQQQEGRGPDGASAALAHADPSGDAGAFHEPPQTRFDRLFTLSEQKTIVTRLLKSYPRLAMSDKIGLATALLLPAHYHGGHVDNLIEVLQLLVHQQYRAYAAPSSWADPNVSDFFMTAVSPAGTATTSPYRSPAASPAPPPTPGAQRRAEGKRMAGREAMVPPPLTPPPPSNTASTPLNAPPRLGGRTDLAESAQAAVSVEKAGEPFAPICGCSLLLVTAVEGSSTDSRALQRYADESGDMQTTLCYAAAFCIITSSSFRLWREAYRQQMNEQGLPMWRSQLDLQCVKLLHAREEAENDAAADTRAAAAASSAGGGGAGGAAASGPGMGVVDAKDAGGNGGGAAGMGTFGGGHELAGASAVAPPAGSAAALLGAGMTVPKGFPTALGALGGDLGAAPPSSAAAMMSTQTAMMMKRTLKGFAQTTATSNADRDRTLREAAAAAAAGAAGHNPANDPHRTVELRCNCGQAMHATAPGKSSMATMASTNLTRKQLIPCGNPECRQWQTPMCTVCGERMEHRATELPPERFFAWCSVCLHGGHWCHLREWFSKHTKCPVENCPCHCCDNAHLT